MADLENFPEDWERALAVVAHPDDMEYGAAVDQLSRQLGRTELEPRRPPGGRSVAARRRARAANPWVFTDRSDAWDGVRFTAFSGSPQPTHGVDTTDTFDAGVASLTAHRLYLDHLGGDMASPDEFLRGSATAGGERLGTPLAATFEIIGERFGGLRGQPGRRAFRGTRHASARRCSQSTTASKKASGSSSHGR